MSTTNVIGGLAAFGFGMLCNAAGISLFRNPTLAGWIVTIGGAAAVGLVAAALAETWR